MNRSQVCFIICLGAWASMLSAMHTNESRELPLRGESAKLAEQYVRQIADGRLACDEEVAQFLTQDAVLNRILSDPEFFKLFAMHVKTAQPFVRCILDEVGLHVSEAVRERLSAQAAIVLVLLYKAYGDKKMPTICQHQSKHLDYIIGLLCEIPEFAYLIPAACSKCSKREPKNNKQPVSSHGGASSGQQTFKNPLFPFNVT